MEIVQGWEMLVYKTVPITLYQRKHIRISTAVKNDLYSLYIETMNG